MMKKIFTILLVTLCVNQVFGKHGFLVPSQCLQVGQLVDSPNNCFRLSMQSDGNLVIYRNSNGAALWSSQTPGICAKEACMQLDGNFVVYDCQNRARWSSGTPNGRRSELALQNDGNLVIYAGNDVTWASNSQTHC
ncbi:hypothetical protein PVAND_009233 [Polypedilum vanderplanki]|uniref:Bulb-type lectin domain-containing protein n=1 Tax=Polypedilum vanderplanki TaxID=319348 RepID=A0A9J6CCH1_POLVA|nr:hypothetical protein PVAND_009233 [Polypedilum vanderplanki]